MIEDHIAHQLQLTDTSTPAAQQAIGVVKVLVDAIHEASVAMELGESHMPSKDHVNTVYLQCVRVARQWKASLEPQHQAYEASDKLVNYLNALDVSNSGY